MDIEASFLLQMVEGIEVFGLTEEAAGGNRRGNRSGSATTPES